MILKDGDSQFKKAVFYMGGLSQAARLLNMDKAKLWYQLNKMKAPISIETCEKIEKLTNGKYTIRMLRPDLIYTK